MLTSGLSFLNNKIVKYHSSYYGPPDFPIHIPQKLTHLGDSYPDRDPKWYSVFTPNHGRCQTKLPKLTKEAAIKKDAKIYF